MGNYNTDTFKFYEAKFGDSFVWWGNDERIIFKILSVVNHGCGEGFVVALHPDGGIWVFCSLEGGYSWDGFNFSEVMREEIVTEEMSKRLYNNISSFIRNNIIDTKEGKDV